MNADRLFDNSELPSELDDRVRSELSEGEQLLLTRITRKKYGDGSGDLVFEEITTLGSDSDGHRTTSTKRRGFMSIDRVKQIEELLRRALLAEAS